MNNLRKYRVWKNITQEELAKELNISVFKLRQIEVNGEIPRAGLANSICEYFKINWHQMFDIDVTK